MRRLALALLTCTLAVLALVAGMASASARPATPPSDEVGEPPPTDLPAGFTDGIPVGTGDDPSAAPVDGTEKSVGTTKATPSSTRYVGDGPWAAINQATEATTRCGGLSAAGLTALVVSPVFKESSAATTAASAGSPMTLSRYDEWDGVTATTSNKSANYGLYAFRDPETPWTRAYWHPGIGIWQYDSAGVGAPYTAIERMNVRIVAGDVAKGMAARYCDPPLNIVGHAAPFTEQERRDAAWWPWWAGTKNRGCPLCQAEFDRMTAGDDGYFANIKLVPGISITGGAVQRSCTVAGVSGPVECWYVDPSVGVIQGATGWATVAPDGNGSSTKQPAPLSRPFYVLKVNGYEERHWIRADTGYSIDISAKRLLGKNARPRSTQAGSGLAWSRSSSLCDLTAKRGPCGVAPPPPPAALPVPPRTPADPLAPPSGLSSSTHKVNGTTYRPIALDANGDGKGDVFFYAPGATPDYLWLGTGSGRYTSVRLAANTRFDDVIPLDANGDGRDDILFHNVASGATVLWRANGNGTFTSLALNPGAGRRPVVGDFDGNGRDDVLWYGPGGIGDSMWTWNGNGFSASPRRVAGNYAAAVGDFDGNGTDDIVWYAPGTPGDSMWLHKKGGGYVTKSLTLNGIYWPVVGDFDGNGNDDIAWYAPGTARDSVWFGGAGGAFASQSFTVDEAYAPIVADLGGDGRDDLVWYAAGDIADLWTRWGGNRTRSSVALTLGGNHRAVTGAFSAGGKDGIFWYAPGPASERVWWR